MAKSGVPYGEKNEKKNNMFFDNNNDGFFSCFLSWRM